MNKTEAIHKIRAIRDNNPPTSVDRLEDRLDDEGFGSEAQHVATAAYLNVLGTLEVPEPRAMRAALNTLSGWIKRTESDFEDGGF